MYFFRFSEVDGLHESTQSKHDNLFELPFFSFSLNGEEISLYYYNMFNDDYLKFDQLVEICNSGELFISDTILGNTSYQVINYQIGIRLNDDIALYLKIKYGNCVNFMLEEL